MRVTNSTHTHTRIDRHPGWLLLRGLQDDGACGQLLCWHRQFAIAIHSPRGVVADALLLRPCALFHAYGISQALISVDITGQPLTPPHGPAGTSARPSDRNPTLPSSTDGAAGPAVRYGRPTGILRPAASPTAYRRWAASDEPDSPVEAARPAGLSACTRRCGGRCMPPAGGERVRGRGWGWERETAGRHRLGGGTPAAHRHGRT